ncbi:polysaccharide biosynthesis/export family protein [bacterium]|nr:polysaccharide biosynthesis/export family protein [bacterium]
MNRKGIISTCLAAFFYILTLSGCVELVSPPRVNLRIITPEPTESEDYERPLKSNIRGDYLIAPSDVIRITVRGQDDLSGQQQVRPDGKITIQLLDDIHVAGLTPAQVDDLITEELKKYIKEVNVSVAVTGFYSKNVHYIGPSGNAVQLPYTGEMTVLDLITRVGGIPATAAPENTVVIRGGVNEAQMIKINLKEIVYRGDYKDNIVLREDDVVILPANFFSKLGMVVDNFVRGVETPSRIMGTVERNMNSARSLDREFHRYDADMPFDNFLLDADNLFETRQ